MQGIPAKYCPLREECGKIKSLNKQLVRRALFLGNHHLIYHYGKIISPKAVIIHPDCILQSPGVGSRVGVFENC